MSFLMGGLRYAVGPNMANDPFDLALVRSWLSRWRGPGMNYLLPGTSGAGWLRINLQSPQPIPGYLSQIFFDWQMRLDILNFQQNVMSMPFPSGVIRPGDATESRLSSGPLATSALFVPTRPPVGDLPQNAAPGTPMVLPARTGMVALSDADFGAAAKTLGCETAMIKAFAHVEGKDHGFDDYNRPVILFEPTHFARLSGHAKQYRQQYPDLTHKGKKPHLYGTNQEQWRRLQEAYFLQATAALKSASWGRFQQVGEYFADTGYASVEEMVSAMCASEQKQLDAFVTRIQKTGLTGPLAKKDWPAIAAGYNGSQYRDYDYDTKLKDAYGLFNKNGAQ